MTTAYKLHPASSWYNYRQTDKLSDIAPTCSGWGLVLKHCILNWLMAPSHVHLSLWLVCVGWKDWMMHVSMTTVQSVRRRLHIYVSVTNHWLKQPCKQSTYYSNAGRNLVRSTDAWLLRNTIFSAPLVIVAWSLRQLTFHFTFFANRKSTCYIYMHRVMMYVCVYIPVLMLFIGHCLVTKLWTWITFEAEWW